MKATRGKIGGVGKLITKADKDAAKKAEDAKKTTDKTMRKV